MRISVPAPLVTRTKSRVPSPRPNSTSLNVTVTVLSTVRSSNAKLPVSVWPSTSTRTPVPETRTKLPASILNGTGRPPTKKTWSISSPVLLISTASVPLSDTPGTPRSATVALSRPAIPLPGDGEPALSMIRKVPLPDVALRMLTDPSPRLRLTSVAAIRSARMSSGVPGMPSWPRPVVICSKAKLPLSVWPATTRLTSSPDTLRNGPATRSRTVVFAPILNVWLIAALVVLNSSEKLPRSETPLLAARPTWALRRPATPAGRMRSTPSPL